MLKPPSTQQVESEQQLEQVRSLILGKDGQLVTDTIKKDARNIVGNVITESLHDRQKKDGSVNKVLLPLVEDAVEHSVTYQSERLVNSLYPLMGSLIRKSVTAFLADLMDKTNQLIENSFTLKGLKWRIKAWQAGVSFAQYIATQTFVYRVEHVFLIHRETGLLLNSVDFNKAGQSDADLISSMLTAINDFVGDSFTMNEDGLKEQLQTVTTDNFNLLIKPGPSALVVAAVTGNPPQTLSNQLQLTLENIHSLYNDELYQFNGNNNIFASAEPLLQDCLLSEQKMPEDKNRTMPWFAWLLVLAVIITMAFQMFQWWEKTALTDKLMKFDLQPGVIVKHLNVHKKQKVELDILRDPDAIALSDWLENNGLTIEELILTERSFYSLAPAILKARAQRILEQYPEIEIVWQGQVLNLLGILSLSKSEKLIAALSVAGFTEGENLTTDNIQFPSVANITTNKVIKEQLFNDIIGRVSALQLNFPVASNEITPKMELTLQRLTHYLQQLNKLADDLGLSFGLLVLGCSDNTGNKEDNNRLSLQRAKNTEIALRRLGVNQQQMYITGLGQIDILDVKNKARKVIFNILFVKKSSLAE